MTEDRDTGRVTVNVQDHEGDVLIRSQGFRHAASCRERYSVLPADPASAEGAVVWTHEMRRDGWHVRTETETRLTCDATTFRIVARLRAWENDDLVRDLEWDRSIPRLLV